MLLLLLLLLLLPLLERERDGIEETMATTIMTSSTHESNSFQVVGGLDVISHKQTEIFFFIVAMPT